MPESFEQNPEFLKERFPGLVQSSEVKEAARRTKQRKGEPVSKEPEARIQNYLDRFKEILARQDQKAKERGINALKKILINRYIVRVEDIPESYWQAQLHVIRSHGELGDWQGLPEEKQLELKQRHLAQIKDDQKGSLEEWIDYLASDRSSYLPDYLKYWAFQGMLRLERYEKGDKAKGTPGRFPERPTGKQRSVKMFPEVNERGLKFIAEAYRAQVESQSIAFRYDIPQSAQQDLFSALARKDFRSLYGWVQEYLPPISPEEMETTTGEWVTYKQCGDPETCGQVAEKLTTTLQGKGSGWCIAGENMARQYLQNGNIHIYYSRDHENNPAIPRVVIVQKGGRVTEVRGIEWEENVDDDIKPTDIISDKLKELGDTEFEEADRDTKYLTAIDRKTAAGDPLIREELVFLYEIERPIKYFGYKKDPRIEEIRKRRNPKEDARIVFEKTTEIEKKVKSGVPLDRNDLLYLYEINERVKSGDLHDSRFSKLRSKRNSREDAPIVLECRPEQIAWSPDEININTKAYIGNLALGVFGLLQEHGIEHIYTSFPGRDKMYYKEFTTGPSEQWGETKLNEFERKRAKYNQTVSDKSLEIKISDEARDMSQKIGTREHPALQGKEIFSLVRLTVKDLFPDEGVHTTEEIYRRAEELGLKLCPPEVGLDLRLKHTNQPLDELSLIATQQILFHSLPCVFSLECYTDGLWLCSDWAMPDSQWNPRSEFGFLFCLRRITVLGTE